MYNNEKSDVFACMQNVRQRAMLSPFLFLIFVSDLEDYFEELNALHSWYYQRKYTKHTSYLYSNFQN
jgi:hypothetical protein